MKRTVGRSLFPPRSRYATLNAPAIQNAKEINKFVYTSAQSYLDHTSIPVPSVRSSGDTEIALLRKKLAVVVSAFNTEIRKHENGENGTLRQSHISGMHVALMRTPDHPAMISSSQPFSPQQDSHDTFTQQNLSYLATPDKREHIAAKSQRRLQLFLCTTATCRCQKAQQSSSVSKKCFER